MYKVVTKKNAFFKDLKSAKDYASKTMTGSISSVFKQEKFTEAGSFMGGFSNSKKKGKRYFSKKK